MGRRPTGVKPRPVQEAPIDSRRPKAKISPRRSAGLVSRSSNAAKSAAAEQDRRGSCGRTPGTRAPPGAPARRRAPGRGTHQPDLGRSQGIRGRGPSEQPALPGGRVGILGHRLEHPPPSWMPVNGSPCAASASAASSTSSTVSSVSLNGTGSSTSATGSTRASASFLRSLRDDRADPAERRAAR